LPPEIVAIRVIVGRGNDRPNFCSINACNSFGLNGETRNLMASPVAAGRSHDIAVA